MSLAGWDAQQSTDALGGVLNLAAASSMGLGEASDMVTDYLSAFGMIWQTRLLRADRRKLTGYMVLQIDIPKRWQPI